MNRLFSVFFIICCIYPVRNADAVDVEADVLFARKIQPLFKVKCFTCHGDDPKKLKGDFDMRTRDGLLKGGESEEASLVPGRALDSSLYLAVTRDHEDDWAAMPPKENDKLTSEQIRHIKQWINAGRLDLLIT